MLFFYPSHDAITKKFIKKLIAIHSISMLSTKHTFIISVFIFLLTAFLHRKINSHPLAYTKSIQQLVSLMF